MGVRLLAPHFARAVALIASALPSSRDGATVYAASAIYTCGSFGEQRVTVTAINATTGAATASVAEEDGVVADLVATDSVVCAGGSFTVIGGEARSGLAARDASGHGVGTHCIFGDVTDRKRAGEGLGDLSDDLSQPLAGLVSDTRRAERGAGRGDAQVPRGPRAPQRRHPLPGVPAAPVGPEGARLAEALRVEGRRRARKAQLDMSMDLDPLPSVVRGAQRSSSMPSRRRSPQAPRSPSWRWR